MMRTELPAGRYLTCTHDIRPEQGGTTRALFMRNRIFAEECGIRPLILSFAAAKDLDHRRQAFLDSGLMTESLQLLNIYEHYREHDWGDADGPGVPLEDLGRYKFRDEELPDGTPWRTTYRVGSPGRIVFDYLRPDGTAYLRIPSFKYDDADSWPRTIRCVSPDGQQVGRFNRLGQWFRQWLRTMTKGDERAFVFLDSRHMVPHLVPTPGRRIHMIYVLHNNHLTPPFRWDSPLAPAYERVLGRVDKMDAMVTLTDRQREDIARRRGETSNLFVVPNPAEQVVATGKTPRDPKLVTVIARLEAQKRLEHAIRAFEKVVKKVPDARMDVYGTGQRQLALQREIERRGLTRSITLKGHDERAKRALWGSSAFLMTSSWEGYPLATLEALSHGCPVVSYDINYGPREQITDGVDGFLVEEGRIDKLANRLVRLLTDPELVERMGVAARDTASRHGTERFLDDWSTVLGGVITRKATRTTVRAVELALQQLSIRNGRLRPGSRAAPIAAVGRYERGQLMKLAGELRVRGHGRGGLGDARVELRAVHEASGAVVALPLRVKVEGKNILVRSTVRLEDLYPPGNDGRETTRLVLRLTWRNSSRDIPVTRPPPRGGGLELTYDADGTLLLSQYVEPDRQPVGPQGIEP